MGYLAFTVFAACTVVSVLSKQPLIVRNCASSDAPIMQLKSASVSPNQIPIPGELRVTGTITVNRGAQDGGLALKVDIERYVGFLWITVPCISEVGSCTYDACKLISQFNNKTCPMQLAKNNIPCTCGTITPGDYSMQDEKFEIHKLDGLYSWLASGDYRVNMKLVDRATKTTQACLHLEGTVVDPTACEGFLCSIFG